MHHFGYTILIALSNNVDNITARIAYSIKGIRISIPVNIYISIITFIISGGAAYSGTTITGILSKNVTSIIAMLLLIAIGLWMIIEPFIKREKNDSHHNIHESGEKKTAGILQVMSNPEKADMDKSMNIDFKEATVLGIALSINNIGGGLSAGMIGINALMMGFLSAVINFIALWAGNYIAEFFMKWNLHRKAAFAAGIILIAIGIGQVI
jgi:putative sporulation protein YtaF